MACFWESSHLYPRLSVLLCDWILYSRLCDGQCVRDCSVWRDTRQKRGAALIKTPGVQTCSNQSEIIKTWGIVPFDRYIIWYFHIVSISFTYFCGHRGKDKITIIGFLLRPFYPHFILHLIEGKKENKNMWAAVPSIALGAEYSAYTCK